MARPKKYDEPMDRVPQLVAHEDKGKIAAIASYYGIAKQRVLAEMLKQVKLETPRFPWQ